VPKYAYPLGGTVFLFLRINLAEKIMKNNSKLILLLLLSFCVNVTYAAFPVKKVKQVTTVAKLINLAPKVITDVNYLEDSAQGYDSAFTGLVSSKRKWRKSTKLFNKLFIKKGLSAKPNPTDEPKVHWAAIIGLSAGVLAFFVAGLFFGIIAIVFSALALSKIGKEPEKYKGKGMAIAGLVLGVIALLVLAVFIGMLL
jgi:hypothetical protein